ncbi:DEAD/DEAH box helicase family protein [bacterium]|nr:DEAD/DEAH box helicase family protein [bacterium]
MRKTEPEPRQLAVDQPILNSPYEEPLRYWMYENKQPVLIEGHRRDAGYWQRSRKAGAKQQMTLVTEEEFHPLELVNEIRQKVRQWRKDGYPGATKMTRDLLAHWWSTDHEPRLFFCQLEAAETVIWLNEIGDRSVRQRLPLDRDESAAGLANGRGGLRRYGCKMATGAGKTVVMAMIAAWTWLNRAVGGDKERYPEAILAVCPGLTIRERLQVLRPGAPGNYYDKFDLLPDGTRTLIGRGRIHITNWHDFMVQDDGRRRGVRQRGRESDEAFAKRVLHDLGAAKNLLVFNDEAHHAYRPPPLSEDELEGLTQQQRDQREEATVWVAGLDRINANRGLRFCLDLSATPFYIGGSGHEEGTPFPWIVSDFGLVDAIESGLVKIPRVPVASNTGRTEPEYFTLWRWINDKLKREDPASAATGRRRAKPEAICKCADGALQQLAGLWQQSLDQFQREGREVPPAMIVVCDNTALAQVMYEHISGERTEEVEDEKGKKRKVMVRAAGQVFPELLQNTDEYQPTMRIDSRLIAEAENEEEGKTRTVVGDELRRKVSTVGKAGEPGEQVRCVVSVAMLTEGWDANNVKQILGLRAFDSQLLCEQVVGRGLRRINYTVDEETGLLTEEYVDVYGVPFEVIPVKKRAERTAPPERDKTIVKDLPERKHLAIEFPLVEGYVYRVSDRIRADLDAIPEVKVEPNVDPTATISRPKVWSEGGPPGLAGPGETVTQTREAFYREVRLQSIEFDLAQTITRDLLAGQDRQEAFRFKARTQLFPQVLQIVREFIRRRVVCEGVNLKEIGLLNYRELIAQRLLQAIEPDSDRGEPAILPRIERFRPKGSTHDVIFSTERECRPTRKSHISHVVLDSELWEGSAAFCLEASEQVEAYAKNDHLGFVIPYEFADTTHSYIPDYLVRMRNGVMLFIEVKGQETEIDRQKWAAAQRWVRAVNNAGQWGKWEFAVVKKMTDMPKVLAELAGRA